LLDLYKRKHAAEVMGQDFIVHSRSKLADAAFSSRKALTEFEILIK